MKKWKTLRLQCYDGNDAASETSDGSLLSAPETEQESFKDVLNQVKEEVDRLQGHVHVMERVLNNIKNDRDVEDPVPRKRARSKRTRNAQVDDMDPSHKGKKFSLGKDVQHTPLHSNDSGLSNHRCWLWICTNMPSNRKNSGEYSFRDCFPSAASTASATKQLPIASSDIRRLCRLATSACSIASVTRRGIPETKEEDYSCERSPHG